MGATIGILGAGQLGRMLAIAGRRLGFNFRFLDPAKESPCVGLGEILQAPFDDQKALENFSQGLSLVTYEFENVPAAALETLSTSLPVRPGIRALEVSQDRLSEKNLCRELGTPTARYAAVESRAELAAALDDIGFPAVLKTRRFGYDGKGQFVLKTTTDIDPAWNLLGGQALILESWVPFSREVSIISVRSLNGEITYYPLVENEHRLGILRVSTAPTASSPELEDQAQAIARRTLEALNYVGVLAIELFEVQGGLIFNEMAPRVHNSGHWTIDGATCSQFENHIRAVSGLPLGPSDVRGFSRMFNFIGRVPAIEKLEAIPGCHVHLYGKSERKGRKVGHCTLVASSKSELDALSPAIAALINDDG